jgi:hypothetical protein
MIGFFDKRLLVLPAGILFAVNLFPSPLPGPFTLSSNDGFCPAGAPAKAPVPTYGSYCQAGDATVGQAATDAFRLTGPFDIYLSGGPNQEGLSLRLENLSDHQARDIRPHISPGVSWLRFRFAIPDSWRGKDLRIVALDRSTGPMGWLAFSGPLAPDQGPPRKDARKILLKTPLFTLLILLPGLALSAFAAGRGCRGTVKLGLVTLAGMAIPGYVFFFLYVISPRIGAALALASPYLSAATFLMLFFRLTPQKRKLLWPLATPLALTMFASMAVLSLGYFYGGLDSPNATAEDRFSHQLPNDNEIPFQFAEYLKHGPVPKPMEGDWLSSDRPPLQTGMILALEPWIRGSQLWYQVASTIIQNLWIVAVWLLLRAFRISALSAAAVIATISLSGFVIVNSFFVWPKLLAAAYMIAFAVPAIIARPAAGRPDWLLRCLMSFLLVCSLLAHGGAAFSLLGLFCLLFVFYRKRIPGMLKEVCLVGAIAAALYSPWTCYQKFVDPPGDRLLKYHLAGVEKVTGESAFHAIYQAYRNLTFDQWLAAKEANKGLVFGHEAEYLQEITGIANPQSKRQVRVLEFFYFLPALGLVGFGAAGLFLRWTKTANRSEARAGERLLLWAFASAVFWILLMFKPSGAVVHQGSYAMVIMAMAGSILTFRAVAPRLALGVCAVQCALSWLVYAPDLTRIKLAPSLAAATNPWMVAVHIIALCGFFAVLAMSLKYPRTHRSEDTRTAVARAPKIAVA